MRTSFLLINLAVADMLVGLTEIAIGLRKIGNTDSPDISTVFQAAFSTASVPFSRFHSTGTSLRFDVASATSRNKHQ